MSEKHVINTHICGQIRSLGTAKKQKRKFSTTPIDDRQLSRQKICQKISVIKTNSFDWKLLTLDDIKKTVHFGILIHVLS